MPSIRTSVIFGAILGLLIGCGGGDATTGGGGGGGAGGGGGMGEAYIPVAPLGAGVLQSTDVENATNNLRWFVENAINGGSLIENIPTTGMATYDGLIAINKTTPSDPTGTPDDLYYGRIQINADFSTTAVNGSMGDFGAINTSSFDANGFPNLRSVPGNASFSGNITDQFMGFTTNRGMYATNVAGSLDGEVVTGDISGLFYTDTQTGLQIIDGGADLSIGSDVDVRTSFIAAD